MQKVEMIIKQPMIIKIIFHFDNLILYSKQNIAMKIIVIAIMHGASTGFGQRTFFRDQ